ncbi:MAG: cache domain-containing protein [Deltaproteobacteria bacterium]|nr:cache domain-containing protein [Deltaproteobacteria bacterium]
MFYSTKAKLIASFLGVAAMVGFVSIFIGGRLLYKYMLHEATTRVRLDLNAAQEIYHTRIDFIKTAISITTSDSGFRSAVRAGRVTDLEDRITRMAEHSKLDFAGIIDSEGGIIWRTGPNPAPSEGVRPENPIGNLAIKRSVPVAGTVILSQEFLYAENPVLADQARIRLVPTPMAEPRSEEEETSGMALASAVPVLENGRILAVVYGGILLNQTHQIVDTVRDTVFKNEVYKNRSIGTATLFFNDVRISTNVTTRNDRRAVGTRVSKAVKDHVLLKGERWTERAFVVNDWYITAYDSIEDIFGDRVGMLYVGILEAKYIDAVKQVVAVFVLVTLVGMVLAVIMGYFLGSRIMSPVRRLIQASKQVSRGSLSPDIGTIEKDEIGTLQNTFKEMVDAIGRRREASDQQLLISQKQAAIGRLAGGVAHEINNPLTGALTSTHMLLRRNDLSDDMRCELETIARSTERVRMIVKGLLDFSREMDLDTEASDINKLVRSSIKPMESHAQLKGVHLIFEPGADLPSISLDRAQFQGVLMNLIINALDATPAGGKIWVMTGPKPSESDPMQKGVEIVVADTGCGISPEDLEKVFDPFFTTKEVGEGTGLGLSVCLGVVQRHGGTIRVRSELGNGSTFRIWLTAAEKNDRQTFTSS